MNNKYSHLFEIIYKDRSDLFQNILDQGFKIGNLSEDVEAFFASLCVHDLNTDVSKPLDAYEFKVAELFLENGFNLQMHRKFLTEQIQREFHQWFNSDGYSPYKKTNTDRSEYNFYPDGRGSAFLIRKKVPLLWLSQYTSEEFNQGRTALDIAYRWTKEYPFQHPLIIPYLKTAGCKYASDLTHHERILASPLTQIAFLGNLNDVNYFLDSLPYLSQDELAGGAVEIIRQMAKTMEFSPQANNSSLLWEKHLNRVLKRGLNPYLAGNQDNWLFTYFYHLPMLQIHPFHLENKTIFKQMQRFTQAGVNVNQVGGNQSVLDLALKFGVNDIIDYLISQGAQTFEYLLAHDYLLRDEYDQFWILKSQRDLWKS